MKTTLAYFLSFFLLSFFTEPTEKKAFEVVAQDSVLIEVMLRYNEDRPQDYVAHVTTPVCKEGLCHILVADLYWDLLGNFTHYELPPDRPLTKFDHEEFTEADYEKLNKILADEYSLLGEHAIEDLVDESQERVSEEVDAVTGATMKSVENTVVSGAVYSTYALWHLANGEIAEQIPKHTQQQFDERMLTQFLNSDHYPYHYYALDQLADEQFGQYMPQVITLMENSSIFVARYALNKIPKAIYEDSVWQTAIVQQFPEADFTTQQLLLQKVQSVPLHPGSLDVLAQQLDQLSEQQLGQVLNLMTDHPERLTSASLKALIELLNHPNPVYRQPAYEALQSLAAQNPGVQEALKQHDLTSSNN